jgi:protein regulator of cytokinesis 1
MEQLCGFYPLTSCSEKAELTDEAHRIIKTIRQMEVSLEDRAHSETYQLEEKELKVTTPLTRCLQNLKEKHNSVAKIHRERFEQVKSKEGTPTRRFSAK